MTNNFENENTDDNIDADVGAVNEQGQKKGSSGKLAAAWRSSPLFKFVVLIIAVFAVGAAAINFFGSGSKSTPESARLTRPPALKEAPGGEASPYLRQQTEMANTERAQQAIASGGSAIPTPLGQTAEVSGFGAMPKKEDPLKELRAETEKLKKQVQQQQQVQAQQQQGKPEQFDNTLSAAMQRQMQQLLTSWTPQGIKNVLVSKETEEEAQEKTGKSAATTPAPKKSAQKIIVGAGTVSYGQLLTEANSDVPGPILAQIVSGPLAGARAVGSFQTMDGYEKYLVMKFSLADKNKKSYAINAVALDPDTTLGGMATEVDERYFTRVVLPAAAAFVQGVGSAMAQGDSSITTSGTTTIVTQADQGFNEGVYKGLSQAAQTVGQFLQQRANVTKPLIRVAAGTPIGIFFVSPVKEPLAPSEIDQQLQGQPPQGSARYYPSAPAGTTGAASEGPGFQGGENNSVPYPNYAAPSYNSGYGTYRSTSPYNQQRYGQ
jgi:intracellular multiplication protein IcmE